MPSTQLEYGNGYQNKFGLRAAKGAGTRFSRASDTENINPLPGSKRSPRLGAANTTHSRPLSARPPNSSVFGADITNVAASRTDKLKPLKPASTSSIEKPVSDLACAQDVEEYAADINNQLLSEETTLLPQADYLEMQPQLTPKMRTILIDWLIEVHMKYKLRPETLHLTINIIDRYLSKTQVTRNKLQLVGVCAMFIAAKFEEIHPPELHDWVYITDKAYTKNDVLMMECTILSALSFRIVVPTVAHILPALQKANECNAIQCKLVQYILEVGLLDVRMLQFPPSHAVCAALLLSNELLGQQKVWPEGEKEGEKSDLRSRYTEAQLRPCAELLRQLFETDRALTSQAQLQAVHKKFSLKDHHAVATMTLAPLKRR